MFFQSVYAQYYFEDGASSFTFELFENKNALPSTYLGDAQVAEGSNLFIPFSKSYASNGLNDESFPTFNFQVGGIPVQEAGFYLDFSLKDSVFWADDCIQEIGNETNVCSSSPTYMETAFNTSGVKQVTPQGVDNEVNGFTMEGAYYMSEICADQFCSTHKVYAASKITEDRWLTNSSASFGFIGLAPES